MKPTCATCHEDAVKAFARSLHATARANGDADGPSCQSCHNPVHAVVSSSHAGSPIAKPNLARTCGACHANPAFLARHTVDFAKPVEAFERSVHGRELARGNLAAPSCSSCHGSHDITRASDPSSPMHRFKVAGTCGTCHTAVRDAFLSSVHGQAGTRGVTRSPTCTDCHGEHEILAPSEPGSLVNPARVSTVTCGACHGDERLTRRFNLPADQVPTFSQSFHGLSARSGRQTVANCASCHGVHNILPSADPKSTVHPANLASTCGTCHPGAGARYALGPVHVSRASAQEHVVVRAIRWAYLLIIPLTIGLMLVHNGLDLVAKTIRGSTVAHSAATVPRMNRHFRIAHWLVQVSFIALVVTGFALKYPESWWARPFLGWEAQVPLRGWIHRIAALVMMAGLAYHVVHVAVRRQDRPFLREMLPRWQDVKDAVNMVRYNLGLTPVRPTFRAFSYGEKAEYFAFMWGTVIMGATGFLLWFENVTLRYFPLWVADAATVLHWYEAILATLAIVVWHLYAVVFDPDVYPMDRAWITGRTSAAHMQHTRPEYYAEVQARMAQRGGTGQGDDEARPGDAPQG